MMLAEMVKYKDSFQELKYSTEKFLVEAQSTSFHILFEYYELKIR